ncbi:MAG: hypothetical protein WCT20_02220 [Candidatus Babeliales bacterium]
MKQVFLSVCVLGIVCSVACQAKCIKTPHEKENKQGSSLYTCKIKGDDNSVSVFVNDVCQYCGCLKKDHDNE